MPNLGPRVGVNFKGIHWFAWFFGDPAKVAIPQEDHLRGTRGGVPLPVFLGALPFGVGGGPFAFALGKGFVVKDFGARTTLPRRGGRDRYRRTGESRKVQVVDLEGREPVGRDEGGSGRCGG